MKRPLSKSQIVCIILLWVALCYIVLVYAERIDGPTILMLIISAALVFIPVYKSLKKKVPQRTGVSSGSRRSSFYH